jgi:hypothetical protein
MSFFCPLDYLLTSLKQLLGILASISISDIASAPVSDDLEEPGASSDNMALSD